MGLFKTSGSYFISERYCFSLIVRRGRISERYPDRGLTIVCNYSCIKLDGHKEDIRFFWGNFELDCWNVIHRCILFWLVNPIVIMKQEMCNKLWYFSTEFSGKSICTHHWLYSSLLKAVQNIGDVSFESIPQMV